MNNGWTTARQTQQAAAIHHWKPWEKSTGPKSPEGKQKASRNAYKGGGWAKLRQELRLLEKTMREQEELIDTPIE